MDRIRNLILDDLPDGRLTFHSYEPGLAVFRHRAGHIHPELLRDIDEYGRHFFRGLRFAIDLDRMDEPPDWEWHFERVSPELMPLTTCSMRGTPRSVLLLVRADMMSREMCELLNDADSDRMVRAIRRADPWGSAVQLGG